MNWNIRQLKVRAAALAEENRSALRQLVLLYCGVLAALILGSNGLNLYLDSQIGTTGGLDGMGLRSVLQTIQEILVFVNMYFSPFWSAGFLFAMMAMVRGREPEKRDLVEGFRRFGRVLAHMAFRFLVMVMLGALAVNLGAVLFSLTPMGQEFAREMAPILENSALINADGTTNLQLIPQELLLRYGILLTVLVAAIFGLLYLCLSYRFRLSMYLVLDRPIGAVQAHFLSMRLMRGHKWQMFKMDLGYWWYYLLMLLVSAVGYLDTILVLAGLPLPLDPMVMYFATLAVYSLLLTGLSLWKKPRVDASYVLAYECIAKAQFEEAAE